MQNDLSRRTFMGRFANTAVGVAVVSIDLTACTVDKAKTRTSPQVALPGPAPTPTPRPTVFNQMKVGGGGFLTGLDVSRDGTMRVVRCDTFGAYKWDAKTAGWLPLLTSKSMPAGEFGVDAALPYVGGGVYEVAVAPNVPNTLYVAFNNRIFRSTNGGTSFTRTAFVPQQLGSNDNFRTLGRKMAVDPNNANVLYLGTQKSGLMRTLDGGATWTNIASVPVSTTDAGVLIAIDNSSQTVNGRKAVVYAASNGNGLYQSTDGGETFVALAGSPTNANKVVVGPDGSVFVTDYTTTAYRFRGGRWSSSKINGWGGWHTIAVDPTNADHVVAGAESGFLRTSYDGGVTWLGTMVQAREAADVPWLAWTEESYMSSGDIAFDPANPGSLLFAEGIGVWSTNNLNGANVNWKSSSAGIEQLVTNHLVSLPNGAPLMFVWDRGVFSVPDPTQYAATHGPSRANSIIHGWHGDFSPTDPNFVAGIFNWWGVEQSGYSTDGGKTWTKFASLPKDVVDGKIGGSIAVASSNSILWLPSNNGNPYVTQDRGVTWTQISLPNVPTTGNNGWSWAYYLTRRIVASDRVTPNTYYMYNHLAGVGGVFRSKDAGRTWERVFTGPLSTWSTYNAKLRTVPGQAGHLFFTEGPLDGGNPNDSPLMRSTDGGATWSKLSNVKEVTGFGFGKSNTAGGYPAIFIVGYVDDKYGVHVSYDEAKSWQMLTDYPNGNFDTVSCVEGDMNVVGRVYVGFSGSGASYGELAAA